MSRTSALTDPGPATVGAGFLLPFLALRSRAIAFAAPTPRHPKNLPGSVLLFVALWDRLRAVEQPLPSDKTGGAVLLCGISEFSSIRLPSLRKLTLLLLRAADVPLPACPPETVPRRELFASSRLWWIDLLPKTIRRTPGREKLE